MLVLTRKLNESVLLGSEIRVTVLGVNGDKVRIGVEAPHTLKIIRAETLDQSREQNRISASSGVSLAALLRSAAMSSEQDAEADKKGQDS